MAKQRLNTLLDAVARRDRTAFEALYRATSPKLFGVAVRILKRSELAEDVLQDTYLKIWDGAASYQPALGSPLGWMVAITRNRAIDVLRKRSESQIGDENEHAQQADDAPDPFTLTVRSRELARLLACMEGLERDHRRCVLLAYYYGYTHEEIAGRVSAPLGTVKSRIRRGLARIRECLDDG